MAVRGTVRLGMITLGVGNSSLSDRLRSCSSRSFGVLASSMSKAGIAVPASTRWVLQRHVRALPRICAGHLNSIRSSQVRCEHVQYFSTTVPPASTASSDKRGKSDDTNSVGESAPAEAGELQGDGNATGIDGEGSFPGPRSGHADGLLGIVFTCGVCETRVARSMTKQAYNEGVVLMKCPGCQNIHLIADNLDWFCDGKINVEDILSKKGEDVRVINEGTFEFLKEGEVANKENK